MARAKSAPSEDRPASLGLAVETALIADLKPHPRNYRQHPDDQIEHLMQSIREHGFYRNIVVAHDNTILAGHGVVLAATKLDMTEVPVVRLDLEPDSPRALKVLAADNEVGHLIEVDDRALSELLKEIKDFDENGLLGTGYDAMMLANLVMVTRPRGEILDHNEAAAWVGMPEYESYVEALKVIVSFDTAADREAFAKLLGMTFTDKTKSIWWPARQRDDVASVRFEQPA